MLYPALWSYRIALKTATDFSPYQLVHGVELVLLVEASYGDFTRDFRI